MIAAAVLVALGATPLGAGIVRSVGDFSSWLRGTPGEPVSAEEQREFDEANAKSWAAFPGSPQLRELTSIEADGVTYRLVGFRSGTSLCIRIRATGEATGSTLRCAPVDDLKRDSAPVRVLLADWGVGRGEKKRTIGFDNSGVCALDARRPEAERIGWSARARRYDWSLPSSVSTSAHERLSQSGRSRALLFSSRSAMKSSK